MEPIQLLLIAALATICLMYLRLTKYRFGGLLLLCLVLLLGVFAVFYPDKTTTIANSLGVGRGADLLLYTTVICFCAALVIIYGRFRKLDERYTEMVRELALLRHEVERGQRG